ncbi:MAG: hypothetical protein KDD29_07105, partial [Flavobacteriales bacterium]|nr:hypothetical protein [Flavobacteriales bacterium]
MEILLDSSKLHFKLDSKKIVENLFDFKVGSAITDIIDIESSNESTAFALIFNTTRKTYIKVSKELDQETLNNCSDLVITLKSIEIEWTKYLNTKIKITKNFFN